MDLLKILSQENASQPDNFVDPMLNGMEFHAVVLRDTIISTKGASNARKELPSMVLPALLHQLPSKLKIDADLIRF